MKLIFIVISSLFLVGLGAFIIYVLPFKIYISKSRKRQSEIEKKILEIKLDMQQPPKNR
jgi:hypothetical protein